MANNSPTIVAASLSDDQLKKSIDSLVTHVDEAMKKMVQSTNNAVGEMEAKLKSLGNVRINSGGTADGGSSRRTSAVEKETKARKELNMTLDQQAAALEKASGKKKGIEYTMLPSDIDKSLTYLVNTNKDVDAQMSAIIQKEQALIDAKQREAQITEQIASAQRAANSVRGVSSYDLGINPNVSAGRQRQIASTRVASKETEYLKQQVASLLEVEEREIKTANATSSSYAQLTQYLKHLQTAYQRLGADRIAKGEGTDIAKEIQSTQRAMQKLQQTMSRPISLKDAMGLSEKTLDDIAYKMQRLRSYKQGIDLTKPNAANEIKQVDEALARLQKDADKWMSKSKQMIKSNTALGRSWNYMKNRLAFYFTIGVGISFIRDLARVRSEYEMNEKALGTLLNSAERGTRIFNELSNMALVSPYTLIELSAASKQLTAYDVAAKDVVDTTRRLADISAAVGIPVERLTYALGQVKAYGHLTSQDARQFLNAGVPLVKELANRYTELEGKLVSTADVYDRMKKHAISYNDVLSVLTSMTDEGGRFFDYQAKMADTLKVRIANLTLAYNNMLNEIGRSEGGAFVTGIKGVTAVLKRWREIERVLGTIIVSIGAYRTATFLAGITTQKVGGHSVAAWLRLSSVIRTTQGNVALLSATMKAIPFAGWVTMIMSLVSYFVFFNNSTDETKQKLEDIATAFEGIRKEVTNLFADAISTDNIGTQMSKLKDILDLAETELGVTIPINLENVNESNIKQKLKEAKQYIDEYLNFSQRFSEEAVDTPFNEEMNKFGSAAKSTYTSISESINAVKVALKELADEGKATKRDIEILNELSVAPKDGESRIEHLQRMVSLYEELGLIGQKKVTPEISFFGSSDDNMEELAQRQENALDRLGIKNKTVYENMLKDVQNYYSSSSIAAYQLERQVMRVAESIDIMNIPVEQRTMKLEVSINQDAAKNNWNDFEKELAFQVANTKFGTTIEISEDSKKDAEMELSDWQKRMQSWADKHGITFSLNFMEKEDEKTYADRMLQAAKDAKGKLDVLRRKLKVGTGSQTDVDNATKDYNNARLLALQAGADLSSLDKKSASSRKAASKAESELAKALKDELSTIDKVRSIYKDLTKEGMSHANAVERATRGWDETVNAINKVLTKNGLQKLDLSKFAGIENPRELVNMLQSQLNTLLKRGAKPAEIKELQTKIQTLNVDADKYDLTKITKGLNSELDRLKEEYELAVELDANPEMGNMFTEMFGIDTSDFPKTIDEYMSRAQQEFDKMRKKRNFSAPLNIFKAGDKEWEEWGRQVGLVVDVLDENGNVIDKNTDALDKITPKFKEAQGVAKKWAQDTIKATQELEYKLGDLAKKVEIEEAKLAVLEDSAAKETNEAQKRLLKLRIEEQKEAIEKLKMESVKLLPFYEDLFGDMYNVSVGRLKEIAKVAKEVMTPRQGDSGVGYTQRTDSKGNIVYDIFAKDKQGEIKKTTVSLEEYIKINKQIDSVQQNIAESSPWEKIKDSFSKKAGGGLKNFASGMEAIGGELQKVANITKEIGGFAEALGADESTVETINDIATSIGGVATAAQGIGQIASGDYIGGAVSVASGLFSAISSWFDNSDKKIVAKIKDSEREVKRLENSYKNLEYAIEQAYGMAEYGARRAAVANRQLQLVELQRQLRLEQSRDSKHRDEDRILELKGQIIDLRNEISQSVDDITNDLLGISSIGDAAEQLVSSMIEAFKQGEDYMLQYDESFEKMIDNMIMKAIVSRVVGDRIEQMWNQVKAVTEQRGAGDKKRIEELTKKLSDAQDEAMNAQSSYEQSLNGGWAAFITAERKQRLDTANKELERIKAQLAQAEKDYAKAIEPTKEDIDSMREMAAGWRDDVKKEFEYWMGAFGIGFGEGADNKQLSALQQGLQSVTETTAGAIEAYMNGVSQQVYLHSDLLTQIRDAVVGFDIDVQTASLSQILLQLQTNYIVMQSMHSMMEGWTTPSGQGIRVELIS